MLIEGKISAGYIETFVERISKYTVAAKLERKDSDSFNHVAPNILYRGGTEKYPTANQTVVTLQSQALKKNLYSPSPHI